MVYVNEEYYNSTGYGTEEGSTTSPTLDNKSVVCRYYQTGSCRLGSGCPFLHPQMEGFTIPHPAYQTKIYTYPPHQQPPIYPPSTSQAHSHFLWQPYPPLLPAFDPRYGVLHQSDTCLDYPDDRSDSYSSGSASSSTAISLEDAYRAFGNLSLGGAEPATTGGVPTRHGDSGVATSPGYVGYGYSAPSAVMAEYADYGLRRGRATSLGQHLDHPFSPPHLLPWQEDFKKKPVAYKTKPCKFYAMSGKCTSGEKCTFIHDPENNKGNIRESSHESALPSDIDLPSKPVDKYEDLRAKDYYPITWRVIGGGVMMGGKRQICPLFAVGECKDGDDCKFAHETEVESDSGGFVQLRSPRPRKGERSPRQSTKGNSSMNIVPNSQKRRSGKVPSPESDQLKVTVTPTANHDLFRPNISSIKGTTPSPKEPEETKMKTVSAKSPTSPGHRRTQSMTIVSSPLPHDKVTSTYAAEL